MKQNFNNEELQDPKGQGMPPPYSEVDNKSVVVVDQVETTSVIPVVVNTQMGPKASAITCVSCNQQVFTRVEHKATTKTHLIAALICLFACWPCVFIPYCTDSCRNADHYCPNCNAYIGTYKN